MARNVVAFAVVGRASAPVTSETQILRTVTSDMLVAYVAVQILGRVKLDAAVVPFTRDLLICRHHWLSQVV